MELVTKILNSFGANHSHFNILINHRKIVDFIFHNTMKLESDTIYKLYKIVDKVKKISVEALNEMVDNLNLGNDKSDIFYEYLQCTDFNKIFAFLDKYKTEEFNTTLDEFKGFTNQIVSIGLDDYIKYDPTIVRGLDYYTGVVFEIFDKHPENLRAICGGGSYADLLKIFGEAPLPGVGFGLGDVTLTNFLTVHNLLPKDIELPKNDIMLSYQVHGGHELSLPLANNLRSNNIKVINQLGESKLSKVFPLAEKRGAKFVGLIGEDELKNRSIQVKNLRTKEQLNFCIDNENDIKKLIELLIK